MNKTLDKILFGFFTIAVFLLNLSNGIGAGTCPTGCTTTVAANTTNYTVTSGQILCIPSGINYNSTGIITLNGGTVIVNSGATLDISKVTFGSSTTAITAATNATPIQITSAAHGLLTGQYVYITGVVGNTAANGTFAITKIDANNFTLDGSIGNGAWTSGGTVGYVNTVSNCGTITGSLPQGDRVFAKNYADNAITVDFNTAGGRFYNYGSPVTFTASSIANTGPHTIYNEGTGVLTITDNTIGKGTTITNNSTAANGLNFSNDVSFNAGDASTISTITNSAGATMRWLGTGSQNFNNYVNINNSGTITSAGDWTFSTSCTFTNYPTASVTLASGKRITANGSTFNWSGTITTPKITIQNPTAIVNLGSGVVLNVSTEFITSTDNAWSFTNPSGCAYLNLNGVTLPTATFNNRMVSNTKGQIYYCGPADGSSSNPQCCAVIPSYNISNATNTNPIVITTTTAHGFQTGNRVVVWNVSGNTNANTQAVITVLSSTTFSMNGVSGNSAYTFGGEVSLTRLGSVNFLGTSSCTAPTGCSTGTCPGTTCTTTANATTSYTVNAGEVLCIPNGVNYNNGGFTITLNGGTIRIASGGTLDLKRVSFGSTAARYIDNCGTLTSSENTNDIDIAAGSSGNGLTITNYSTGTFTVPSLPVNKTFYVRDYNSIINYGTTTMSRNLEESGDNALISNASGLARMTVSGNLVIDRGALKIRGIVTANSFENKNNASATITMYEESRLNVTTTFLVGRANMFSYGGVSGSCAYIDNNAGTTSSTNTTPITNSTTAIYFCGSATSARAAAGLGSATASCTTPTCAVALPVELIHFTGRPVEATVELSWVTASEKNNDYFAIERSADGITYETLGFVRGEGNSSRPSQYSFIDINPFPGLVYYKLKQVDYDGKYEEFDPIVVTFKNHQGFLIYPNPSKGHKLYMKFLSDEVEDVEVIISDIVGKMISRSLIKNDPDKLISVLDPGQILGRGIYLVKMKYNGVEKTEKLVVE